MSDPILTQTPEATAQKIDDTALDLLTIGMPPGGTKIPALRTRETWIRKNPLLSKGPVQDKNLALILWEVLTNVPRTKRLGLYAATREPYLYACRTFLGIEPSTPDFLEWMASCLILYHYHHRVPWKNLGDDLEAYAAYLDDFCQKNTPGTPA